MLLSNKHLNPTPHAFPSLLAVQTVHPEKNIQLLGIGVAKAKGMRKLNFLCSSVIWIVGFVSPSQKTHLDQKTNTNVHDYFWTHATHMQCELVSNRKF